MTQIIKTGDWSVPQAQILDRALSAAQENNHKLPFEILGMAGMSGQKYRMLINRLIEYTPDARYLEIGSWRGSTACSAAYDNKVKVTCIDSWNEEESIMADFLSNVKRFMTEGVTFHYDHSDFYKVDYNNIGKYNVYMFDGPHGKTDQYEGIKLVQAALDNTFTLIVDDYNAPQVKEGTEQAIHDLKLNVLASVTIQTNSNPYTKVTDWHNGYYIAVIKKDQQ